MLIGRIDMFKERAQIFRTLSLSLDAACMSLAFGMAFVFRYFHEKLPFLGLLPAEPWAVQDAARSDYMVVFTVSIVVAILALKRSHLYGVKRADSLAPVLVAYAMALVWTSLAAGASVFALKVDSVSRLFFGYFFGSAYVLMVLKQLVAIALIRRIRRGETSYRHALVIGAGQPAAWFVRVLSQADDNGYKLVGVLLSRKTISSESVSLPAIGMVDDLEKTLVQYPVDEVFIVGGPVELATLAPVAQDLIEKGRVVSLVSSLMTTTEGVRGRVTEFSGVPMISFGPMPHDEVGSGLKRIVDVVTSAVALILFSPVIVVVAGLTRVLDPGPVFFGQERLGVGGKKFRLYKFRSMRTDAEELLRSDPELYRRYVANNYKLSEAEDPRVTRLGRFLRRSSLDELPQLWNVLRGDMTIVGPRPIVPDEIEMYEPYADMFLSTRPGVTGHWQVSGRSEVQYPERAFMDLDYIGQHSLSADLSIMARTVPVVLRRKGIGRS